MGLENRNETTPQVSSRRATWHCWNHPQPTAEPAPVLLPDDRVGPGGEASSRGAVAGLRTLETFDDSRPLAPWLFRIAQQPVYRFPAPPQGAPKTVEAAVTEPDRVMPADPPERPLGRAVEPPVLSLPPKERPACCSRTLRLLARRDRRDRRLDGGRRQGGALTRPLEVAGGAREGSAAERAESGGRADPAPLCRTVQPPRMGRHAARADSRTTRRLRVADRFNRAGGRGALLGVYERWPRHVAPDGGGGGRRARVITCIKTLAASSARPRPPRSELGHHPHR